MNSYLITGGTGLVGYRLAKILSEQTNEVCLLTRKAGFIGDFYTYKWNPKTKEIDTKFLETTDTIIHLTGAGIADKRWSVEYKKEILESRIRSTKLLFETLKNNKHSIKTFIATSAIGIYGNNIKGVADENYPAADSFLANVCKEWEDEVQKIATLGIRVVILRTGVVLSPRGGFIKEVSNPIRKYAGVIFGDGNQMMSWIHVDDLCAMFLKASIDETMQGIYNAIAPNPVSNKTMIKKMAAELKKPILLPNIPAFMLKIIFGEMSEMFLATQNVSSKKIEQAGFQFNFPTIDSALDDLMR